MEPGNLQQKTFRHPGLWSCKLLQAFCTQELFLGAFHPLSFPTSLPQVNTPRRVASIAHCCALYWYCTLWHGVCFGTGPPGLQVYHLIDVGRLESGFRGLVFACSCVPSLDRRVWTALFLESHRRHGNLASTPSTHWLLGVSDGLQDSSW